MGNSVEKFGEIPVTTQIEGKRWESFETTEARLRNQRHLEKAYEWLRNRGKIVPPKGGTKSP
jgi:hypothetical protein